MSASVLLVEDDATMAEVVLAYFDGAGYRTRWVSDGSEALHVWSTTGPDLVILDVMLPTVSGLEVLRRRRRDADHSPVIMLSALGEEEDRVVGLEVGADDYVVKPFSPRELVLRAEALLRRTEQRAGARLLPRSLRAGDVSIDTRALIVTRGDRRVALTSREYDLLAFLAGHPDETFSKEDLLRRVWGWSFGDASTVTVHIRRLREKLEDDPSDPRLLLTTGRSGYRLAGRGTEPVGDGYA